MCPQSPSFVNKKLRLGEVSLFILAQPASQTLVLTLSNQLALMDNHLLEGPSSPKVPILALPTAIHMQVGSAGPIQQTVGPVKKGKRPMTSMGYFISRTPKAWKLPDCPLYCL